MPDLHKVQSYHARICGTKPRSPFRLIFTRLSKPFKQVYMIVTVIHDFLFLPGSGDHVFWLRNRDFLADFVYIRR